MSDKILRAALIGVGNMGKKYVQMIVSGEVSNIKLTAVVIRRDELMEWGETLVNTDGEYVKIFRSADDMFKAEDVDTLFDAVIIATPHKTHAKLAVQAFSLGKDVLCDKPAASDIGEALTMNEAAKKSGRIYGMVFHQRLYPKYMKIKSMIDAGELGELRRVNLINSRYLRTSYYHHSQRMFALIPFGKYNDFAVDDEDTIIMDYDNGMTASFVLTTGEACHEERLEIIGTKAKLLLEDNTLTITRHQDVEEYIKTEMVNSRENMQYVKETIEFPKAPEPYTELLERFARASLEHNDTYLVAKGDEGINSLMLCAGAYYSACNGIQVKLPVGAEDYSRLMEERIMKEKSIKNNI